MKTKNAAVVAASLSVLCPHCGEAQPAPNSDLDVWSIVEVKGADGSKRDCVACDEPMAIYFENKVMVLR